MKGELMTAVLISVQPKWCELIANGKKTWEIRKTRTQIDTPFKSFIYCTKQKAKHSLHTYITESAFRKEYGVTTHWRIGKDVVDVNSHLPECRHNDYLAEGKVIGEFVCDNIMPYMQDAFTGEWFPSVLEAACLSADEMDKYAGGKHLYGWHISELVIYDKPRKLGEFYRNENVGYGDYPVMLTRAPQSWQYVQEVDDNA